MFDPYAYFSRHIIVSYWNFHTGSYVTSRFITYNLSRFLLNRTYELAIVDNGELINPDSVSLLKSCCAKVVNFNLDNPFSGRDKNRFRQTLKCISMYDAMFFPRESSVHSALKMGARSAYTFWQAADDQYKDLSSHPTETEKAPFVCDVSFTGTFFENRDEFICQLIDRDVDIYVNGPRWQKSRLFENFKNRTRLLQLSQRQFHSAIAASTISIGLLSHGNLDLHTTRSMEIPTLGSLLVAERTPDHVALYDEGSEAFFWSTVDECAAIIHKLLADRPLIQRVSLAGQQRALRNNNFNRPLMERIIMLSGA